VGVEKGARALNATNLMFANKIPETRLITVKGGEDYEFEDFSLRVLPSLHSECGTLAYLIRIGGHEILVFDPDIERELEGLQPDVVMAGPYGDEEIHDYTRRLIRVLGNPQLVLPTHWDNFWKTFDVPQNTSSADKFLSDVRRVSPSTKTMVPKYFEPITLPPRDAQ